VSQKSAQKIAIIGGGGVRTPMVVFGINEGAGRIGAEELWLYDTDGERVGIMAALSEEVVARSGGNLRLRVARSAEEAVEGAAFVLNSVRVGGIASRARDERTAIEHGYPGQETTGPGGVAMALRTIPLALEQARLVERLSPAAWIVNFTNPAGIVTQAISVHTGAKIVGICDTPTELFHRIALALALPPEEVRCEYVGLNHLGWVTRVWHRGEDKTAELLANDEALRSLYSASLFEPALIRALGLFPTEYLFFYYSRRRALKNQLAAGATRGEEIIQLNEKLMRVLSEYLAAGNGAGAYQAYIDYLNQRSGSYMKLEASAGSAFHGESLQEDPFRAATGYHRIALEVIEALCQTEPRRVVVNVRNRGAIDDLPNDDIVETACTISNRGIMPESRGSLPEAVRGLVLSVKAYEHALIAAAVDGSPQTAQKAMLLYPAIGEWEPAGDLLRSLMKEQKVWT
jgi:6-phospho-beta-glucosidase